MGTYRQPGEIKVADTSVIGEGMQSGMAAVVKSMQANAAARKKKNNDLINQTNKDYNTWQTSIGDVKNTGMLEYDTHGQDVLRAGGNEYYNIANEINKGNIPYSEGKNLLNNLEKIPSTMSNFNASAKAFFDDMNAAMQLQPGTAGYVDVDNLDPRLSALYKEFRDNGGKNIMYEPDWQNGNVMYRIPGGEGEEDVVLNGAMFNKTSYEGVEMIPKVPDFNASIGKLVDGTKKELNYDSGLKETIKGDTKTTQYKNLTGRDGVLLKSIAANPNYFDKYMLRTDFKNSFGSLIDMYGDQLSKEDLNYGDIPLDGQWFYGTSQGYENGKLTPEALKQKQLGDKLLRMYVEDPNSGYLDPGSGRIKTAVIYDRTTKDGSGTGSTKIVESDFNRLWDEASKKQQLGTFGRGGQVSAGLPRLLEYVNNFQPVGGKQYFDGNMMMEKIEELKDQYSADPTALEQLESYGELDADVIYEYNPTTIVDVESKPFKAIGNINKTEDRASVLKVIKKN
tara:strand:+ start:612 stop:2135 length:1524 start_codon:yes stop_codon:yes gene_type:complete